MSEVEIEIIKLIQLWQEQQKLSLPHSSYYYYCYGIEQGLKLALKEISK